MLPPRSAPTYRNPTQVLDFDRFSSDELLACFLAEKEVLRAITPDVPVTTNFMGLFRGADYWTWAPHVDVVADDLYPNPADPDAPFGAAAARDLMRSLGGGRPWLLMEQAPSAVNWRPQNAAKAPGQMRAWSYQALARGADGILFFQWRQSRAGAEKFHSGMVPHSGTETRVFREITQLGGELASTEGLVGTTTPAQAAIVFDWPSWWALEQEASPTTTAYLDVVLPWHRALAERGVVVDFARADETLARYPLVIVPALYSASDAQLAAIDAAVQAGSTVLVTGQSAVLDEHLHVRLGGYLGGLQQTLGLSVEEFTPPAAARESGRVSSLTVQGDTVAGSAHGWAEVVRVHDAEVRATFVGGALDGLPAVTRRDTATGVAWYLATRLDREPLAALIDRLAADAGIELAPVAASGWLEVVRRGDREFVINHGHEPVRLDRDGVDELTGLPLRGLELESQGVAVAREQG